MAADALDGRASHATAFFGAAAAFFGAVLAVLGFVFVAFSAAGVTDVGAHATDFVCKVRTAAHESRGGPANFGTIPVQANTFGHLGDILLAETSIGAMFAFLGTLDTCLDTRLIGFMSNRGFLLSLSE